MKKNKLLMPIIGISATTASLVPLTSLASCGKQELKVELKENSSKEKKIYANTSVTYFYFKQNDLVNYAKTRVKLVNLKINETEVQTVAGLISASVDAAGNIRVAIDIDTVYNHYNNPNTIEFDLQFTNKVTNQSVTISGFKITADQTVKIPTPFAVDSRDDTIIKGFDGDLTQFTDEDFATAKFDGESIFVPVDLPDYATKVTNTSLGKVIDGGAAVTPTAETTYYKMVFPARYTKIADGAFKDGLHQNIKSLDFAANSNMKELGASCFMGCANLLTVNLPESIETLNEQCFEDCKSLSAFHFAATNKKGKLVIPSSMLKNTQICFLKIPTYITKIGTDSNPTISTSKRMILDFTEWSSTQITAAADKGLFAKTIIKSDNVKPIVADVASQQALKTALTNAGISGWNDPHVPYKINYEEGSDETELVILFDQGYFDYFDNFSSRHGYHYYQFELPNKITDDKGTHEITSIKDSYGFFKKLVECWMLPSIILPNKLTSIPADIFNFTGSTDPGNDYQPSILADVYVPSTVTSIGEWAFASNPSLNIHFDGTSAQWAAISKGNNWNYGCTSLKVICTDKTI